MNKKLLNKALRKYKTQAALARALGTSKQFVNQWLSTGDNHRPVPNQFLISITNLLNNEVKS